MRTFGIGLLVGLAACNLIHGRPEAQDYRIEAGQSAVLGPDKAQRLVKQCSRTAPQIEGAWRPSTADISQLEKDLPRLTTLRSKDCCFPGKAIRSVNDFLRQYAGVIVDGKRVIYINAFPVDLLQDWPAEVPGSDWRNEPIIVCDGGPGCWGVLYDPRRREFWELTFNGVG